METWQQIDGYSDYFISNQGRVKSVKYGKERILKPGFNNGYYFVILSNGEKKKHRIHRLVGLTFLPNPKNKTQINHIDGNKLNNYVNNLEWVTASENMQHAFRIGLFEGKKPKEVKNKTVKTKPVKEPKSKLAKGHKAIDFYHNEYGLVTATKQALCCQYCLNPVAISSLICGFRNSYEGWTILRK